ncbi:MAG TPA: MlaD family protein [Pseudonocardiaceae bacterium]|jgi:phospholipid/cholesterol/gamma-HCH transport system substrate-binding protein|nr:MlaD family protein [Pseudonocardiaceae bacterium]
MRLIRGTAGKIIALSIFFVLSMVYTGYLLGKAGVSDPFAASQYQVAFQTNDAANLIAVGDVETAGVTIGQVASITQEPGRVDVVLNLDSQAAPIHQGATVRIGAKSLAGESYVDVVDGHGPSLSSGTVLPGSAVLPSVQLSDVLASIDPKTRASLGSLVRTLGAGTAGTQQNLSGAMTGLGQIGNEGYTAVDAIAAQSKDLTALAQQTTAVLGALDEGEGQISSLVGDAQQLTSATSGQQQSLTDTVRLLPGVLDSTQSATQKLTQLSSSLAPVAANLRTAAPYLNTALRQLPATTADLRGLLPDLNNTLQQAPATLDRVPAVAQDATAMVPQLRTAMSNLDPMLGYLEPYGPELGAFFSNFSAIMKYTDEAGIHFFRLGPDEGTTQIVRGVPLQLPELLSNDNPYPSPGQSEAPTGRPFAKVYPNQK